MRHSICDLALALVVGWGAFASTAAGQDPNPLALLRGAAAAREAVKSGYLEVAYSTVHPLQPSDNDSGTLAFEFDGDKRTVAQTTDLFFIDPGKGRAFDAVGGDRREAERRGIGKTRRTTMSHGWDGAKLASYWSGSVQASYRNPQRGTTSYAFDPRTLGVNIDLLFSSTIERCLGLEEPRSVSLVGQERVADRPAWRIQVINRFGYEFHYWVEGRSPFRVLRKKYLKENGSWEAVEGQYDPATDSPLPRREVVRLYNKTGQLFRESTMTVTRIELNRPVSDKVGTMASLNVPVGTEVSDDAAGKEVGYWNGTGISPTRAEAVQQTLAAITGEPQGSGRGGVWPWALAAGAVAAVGVGVWWYRTRGGV